MKKYSKKEIIIISSFVLLVLVSIIGITFAWFSSEILGNDTASTMTVQMANLKLVYTDTNVIKEENILPGWTMTKTFSVENESNTAVNYNINIIDVTNTFVLDDLVYEITSTNNGGTKVETVMPTEEGLLLSASIGVGVTQEYQMKITFKETGSDQNSDQGKLFTGKIQINDTSSQDVGIVAIYVDEELVQSLDEYKNYAMEEYECTNGETIEWDIPSSSPSIKNFNQRTQCTIHLTETSPTIYNKLIIDNDGGESDIDINFADISSVTNGEGLYYTADTTYGEDGKRIYYYRGDVDNNWVNLGGYKWRIARTTSEGGVKLAYSGDGEANDSAYINEGTKFNSSVNSKHYVGYTYNTTAYTTLPQTNSTVKGVIDSWYGNWINSETQVPNYLSETAIYCGDRSSEKTLDNGSLVYLSYDRVSQLNRPSFLCSLVNKSRYTVSNNTGNGLLFNPIGLLSVDEINFSGLTRDTSNKALSSYINDNANNPVGVTWWTMSPYSFIGEAYVWAVHSTGFLMYQKVSLLNSVRPSVALKSCVTYTGVGDGSQTTPYEISADNC